MTTVAIVGAGEIGGACAETLAARDCVARILIVDDQGNAAAGKALDIQQSGAIVGFHTQLGGTSDLSKAIACAVWVIADRFAPGSPEWTGEDGLALIKRIAPMAADAPIVFAGAASASLIDASAREARINRRLLIGSSAEAHRAAITAIVAMEARCSPRDISITVLGVPPAAFVVPWSEASAGGYALTRVLSQVQLARLEARIARLWPPGPAALGAAAARVVQSIVEASRRSVSVLTILGSEFGVRDRVGAVPALLAASGIVHMRIPTLNTRERVLLETALGV